MKSKPTFARILSIDGGGIRGIIPGRVLVHLERILQEKTANPQTRIADYFDLIAGTSTGGILTCGLLCPDDQNRGQPKFTAEELVALYNQRGDEIFDLPFFHKVRTLNGITDEKYPAEGLEKALKEYFGETRLSDLLKPCLVSSYDVTRRKAHFFTSHDAAVKEDEDFLVRDVCRATSAAPTYFECEEVTSGTNEKYPLIDGGVFANNPTLCAFAEMHTLYNKKWKTKRHFTVDSMVILSLGTGSSRNSYAYQSVKNWGMVQWIQPVIDIMMAGVSDTVEYQVKQIFESMGCSDQYLRVQTDLPGSVSSDMDNATPGNLKALTELGDEVAKQYAGELSAFADLLLKIEEEEVPFAPGTTKKPIETS